ncbi:MAG: FG-GAP-like repeat-containing protein [Gammaproteobacteria bacterium]|nr:FG-GAP-like repeat-containing protein [Gammaproteobacteria bacterium]
MDKKTVHSRSITQIVTVEDTQAPIMLPPPGLVFESTIDIDLNTKGLGWPLVVDLADLHPTVASSTTSADGLVAPDTRTIVTWTATDASANQSTVDQLVTVKTPGTNTAPTAFDQSTDTLTSQPVDIVLGGLDTDELPYTGGVPAGLAVDPLKFRIEQEPLNGEFVAPLYPYFINDYRTDTTGVLSDDLAFAQAGNNQLYWLEMEYCQKGLDTPVNFIFNPLFVQVTDNGEQYFLDYYTVCDPNGNGDVPIEERIRISRWDKDRNFLGHVNYNPGGSQHNSSFVLDPDGNIYYLLSSGVNEYSLNVCDSNITDTTNNPPANCAIGINFDSNAGSGLDISRSKYARADSSVTDSFSNPLIYLTDGQQIDIYSGSIYRGTLANDAGMPQFMSGLNCAQQVSGYGMELDSQGNFYIADTCANKIHKFTPSSIDSSNNLIPGSYVGWMGQCTTSTNLACDDTVQHSKGYSCTDATCTSNVDGSGSGISQFQKPVYLAMDPNDVLYVADYSNQRIQRFAADGTFAGQAQSEGNGINAPTEGGFVLGNIGPPRHVSVNSEQFFVVDQSEKFVHVFETSPFKDITDSSATVTYVSPFAYHSETDTFTYSVDDGLVKSNTATVSVNVARNYRQPKPTAQIVNVKEDGSVVIVLSGSDPDGILQRDFNGLDSLSFTITQQPASGKLLAGGDIGDLVLDPGMSVWTYTPDRDYFGSDVFSFTVRDAFTDATFDGAIPIPEPYTAADPAEVVITVESVNDIPVVEVALTDRVAAGFPVFIQADIYDDLGANYAASVEWGDGEIDQNGEIKFDDNGTPNDFSDDTSEMTGVIFSHDGLHNIGETPLQAMHSYASPGPKTITVCMRDSGFLESCDELDIVVEDIATMGMSMTLSTDEVIDGLVFDANIRIVNSVPMRGVIGKVVDNVTLRLEIPEGLIVSSFNTAVGSCSTSQTLFSCTFGSMNNGANIDVGLQLKTNGRLIYDQQFDLEAEVTTDTPTVEQTIFSLASFKAKAIDLDRDDDGLTNIFEAYYGVSSATADDDNDGLSNLAELNAGTSPIDADSDADGISDGAELNTYGSDPLSADSDGDGLSDGDEVNLYATNPASSDSDSDGLPDNWELDNGFNPLLSDGSNDADADGLSDSEEYALNTDYLNPDSDGDGIVDGEEVYFYETDPSLADTDSDGLNDGAELIAGSDLLKPDTDDDGLLDGEEVAVFNTLPLYSDTDRDGLLDGWETRNNKDPLIPEYKLAAGGLSTCALTDAGVECWGRNDFGQAPAVVGGLNKPVDVKVGFVHACAIDEAVDGSRSVKCWGNNVYGQSTPPALVEPLQISAGTYHSCALDQTSAAVVEVKCWGRDLEQQVSAAPVSLENPVKLVSTISGHSNCVLDEKSTGAELVCWGLQNNANTAIPTSLASSEGPLALGSAHGCIVDGDNRLCWGADSDGQAPAGPVASNSVQLSLGGFHSCSLNALPDDKYSVECWGRNVDGQTDVPVSLVQPLNLASGSHHSCTLDQGSAKCWGVEINYNQGQAPALRSLNIDSDGDGIRTSTEISNGTDPMDADSDRDGISDNLEGEYLTDATNPDSDGDGISDGDEVFQYFSNPVNGDTDGDGLPDQWEIDFGTQILVADGTLDLDGDGVTNLVEFINNTNPNRNDTDGDGIDDAIELTYLSIQDSAQLLSNQPSKAVRLGDLDGDGDLDVVVGNNAPGGNNVWFNDGTGIFTLSPDGPLNNLRGQDVALGDVDGDGDLDIALSHSNPGEAHTLWINAAGTDPEGVFSDSGLDLGDFRSRELKFGQFDETPGAGLYIANFDSTDSLFYFQGNEVLQGFTDSPSSSHGIALGDFDGDGIDDVITATSSSLGSTIYINRTELVELVPASGEFIPYAQPVNAIELSNLVVPTAARVQAIELGDLNGDGLVDIYIAMFNASDQIWLNDASDSFHFNYSGQNIGNEISYDVELADMDKDGDLDAVVANDGLNKIWLNDGSGFMIDSGLDFDDGLSLGVNIGDLDGDGDLDVIVANSLANKVWLLQTLSPTDPDSDGDGAFDGWEVANGLSPLDNTDGNLDSDNDGLINADEFDAGTDPHNADSDFDGMPDGWEVANGLDPNSDDASLDLDADGASNLNEFQTAGVAYADDIPPSLTVPADVTENSTGALTDVAIGTATATDIRDGSLTPVVNNAGPYIPGGHTLTWSASDFSGNTASATQFVGVIPLINFATDQTADEGATAIVDIELNGSPLSYPVELDYSVSGDATNPEDHDAVGGKVILESGLSSSILINIVEDQIIEGEETFTLSMDNSLNAVIGSQGSHTVTISQVNFIPIVDIIVQQQGKTVTTATVDGGSMTISVIISDPNITDIHSINWGGSDAAIRNPVAINQASYTIDPSGLGTGLYRLVVDVADNGTPVANNRAEKLLRLDFTSPVLSSGNDTDNDGIDDLTEGAGDSDNDGIADYLDAYTASNVLEYSADGYILESQTGLSLRLGETAFSQGSNAGVLESAVLEEIDLGYPNKIVDVEIHGAEPATPVLLIVPLHHPVTATAVLRRFVAGAWDNFTIDTDNQIFSSPGSNGSCPTTGDISYEPGLIEGYSCLQIMIQDGGLNDADGLANGVIEVTLGLAVPIQISMQALVVSDKTVLGGSQNIVLMAIRLQSDSGDTELTRLTLQASGSGDDSTITLVKLVIDANSNGIVDEGELSIANGSYSGDDAMLELRMAQPFQIPAGETDLLLSYDF